MKSKNKKLRESETQSNAPPWKTVIHASNNEISSTGRSMTPSSQLTHGSWEKVCPACAEYCYNSPGILYYHYATEHVTNNMCLPCDLPFDNESMKHQHILQHINIVFNSCHLCGVTFDCPQRLADHVKVMHGGRYHTSAMIKGTSESSGSSPRKSAKSPGRYLSDEASNIVQNIPTNNIDESEISEGEETTNESQCEKQYDDKFLYYGINSMEPVSANTAYIACIACSNSVYGLSKFRKHFIDKHTDKDKSLCFVCDSSFNSVQKFVGHVRHHVSESLYRCSACEETFALKRDFLKHLALHGTSEFARSTIYTPNQLVGSALSSQNYKLQPNVVIKKEPIFKLVAERDISNVVETLIASTPGSNRSDEMLYYGFDSLKPIKAKFAAIPCICGEVCVGIENLKTHLYASHTTNNNFCTICEKSFSGSKHIMRHVNRARFTCSVCQKSFFERLLLLRHMHHHKPEEFSSFQDGGGEDISQGVNESSSADGHRQENNSVEDSTLFSCTKCPQKFENYTDFIDHKVDCASSNASKRIFKECPFCERNHIASNYKRHILVCQKKIKAKLIGKNIEPVNTAQTFTRTCKICKKVCRTSYNMKRHLAACYREFLASKKSKNPSNSVAGKGKEGVITATADGKFICPHCNLSFDWKSYLIRHLHTHAKKTSQAKLPVSKIKSKIAGSSRLYTYICSFCQRCFNTPGNLGRHIRDSCPVRKSQSSAAVVPHGEAQNGIDPSPSAPEEHDNPAAQCSVPKIVAAIGSKKSSKKISMKPWSTVLVSYKDNIVIRQFGKIICINCSKRLPTKISYTKHFLEEHTDRRSVCKHCDITPRTSLRKHIANHVYHSNFSCPRCDTSFPKKRAMIRHMRVAHSVKLTVMSSNSVQFWEDAASDLASSTTNETSAEIFTGFDFEDNSVAKRNDVEPGCGQTEERFEENRGVIGEKDAASSETVNSTHSNNIDCAASELVDEEFNELGMENTESFADEEIEDQPDGMDVDDPWNDTEVAYADAIQDSKSKISKICCELKRSNPGKSNASVSWSLSNGAKSNTPGTSWSPTWK